MGTRDSRVDAYVDRSAEFARPILTHLRELVHDTCPEVEETIKWGMPYFMYRGMLCNMAAFKQHCAFGFWKRSLIDAGNAAPGGEAMGQFGRITSVSDLPAPRVMARYIRQAMKLNETGTPPPARRKAAEKPAAVPDDFARALRANRRAQAEFDAFPPGRRREYVEWIIEAKHAETRLRRIRTAVEWIAEGKPRYWKYASC